MLAIYTVTMFLSGIISKYAKVMSHIFLGQGKKFAEFSSSVTVFNSRNTCCF